MVFEDKNCIVMGYEVVGDVVFFIVDGDKLKVVVWYQEQADAIVHVWFGVDW